VGVRLGAAQALGRLGPEPADVPPLALLLRDPDSDVRAAAVAALVAPDTPAWRLGPAFVEFAVREAARMTLERSDGWAYSEGTLLSFLRGASADPAPSPSGRADTNDDKGVAFALAMRASGIAAEAWLPFLELAHHPNAGEPARFVLRLLADDRQRPLLDLVGAPQSLAWDRAGRGAGAAGALAALFREADAQGLARLRQEAALRLSEAAQHADGWSAADLPDLRRTATLCRRPWRPALDARIATLERASLIRRAAAWVSGGVLLHIALWLALVTAYPHLRVVQAVFFWNPWVRTIIGLGYAVPLLLLVPPLRRRLVAPFRDTLLADARLEGFDPPPTTTAPGSAASPATGRTG
jgi:hypothetical protein